MGSHESCYYSDDVFKKHNLHVSDASWSIKYIYVHLFIWILQKIQEVRRYYYLDFRIE